jgi:hypothetical protein
MDIFIIQHLKCVVNKKAIVQIKIKKFAKPKGG